MERYYKFDILDFKHQKCNFHTHTKRCHHAVGDERAYVEKAIGAGFEVLGFSDHAPYLFENGFVSDIRMEMRELEGYVRTMERLKKEYEKEIRIFTALEMEYFPGLFEATIRRITEYPLDYLLLAQHCFYEKGTFLSTRRRWTDEMHLKSYVSLIADGIDTGYFNAVAHPDILGFTGDAALYSQYMTMLAQKLKQERMPVEINVNGLREGANYPDKRFVSIAAENGNDFIVGVDAHNPKDFEDAATYQSCVALAEGCGGKVYWT